MVLKQFWDKAISTITNSKKADIIREGKSYFNQSQELITSLQAKVIELENKCEIIKDKAEDQVYKLDNFYQNIVERVQVEVEEIKIENDYLKQLLDLRKKESLKQDEVILQLKSKLSVKVGKN